MAVSAHLSPASESAIDPIQASNRSKRHNRNHGNGDQRLYTRDTADSRCPHGGSEFTTSGVVTYACNGVPGTNDVAHNCSATSYPGIDLAGCTFSGADLDPLIYGATLTGVNLTGVLPFADLTITGATLTGATCPNGDIYGAAGTNC